MSKALKNKDLPNERAEILSRLRDYSRMDLAQLRSELVRQWREAHPEAAREASSALKPLMRLEKYIKRTPDEPDEQWFNDTYIVTVRRKVPDRVFETKGIIQLGISCHDGTARHDWRDFQAIKNQLAGEECEAFELYPAEARLLDPSNYYTLWCFPGVKRIRVGHEVRRVLDAGNGAIAPQRAFAHEAAG